MTTTAPQLTESELQEPQYVEAVARNRRAKVLYGLTIAALVLTVASNGFGWLHPVVGLLLVAAAVSVQVTLAAAYRIGEPYWWLRIVWVFGTVLTVGVWIIGLIIGLV